jgi:transposase
MNPNAIHHVYLALEPVDMRLGIDGLSSRIVQQLGKSPCDGHAYAFTNRARNRLKLVVWDGNGVWLCQRRLHQGHFVWPKSAVDAASSVVNESLYFSGYQWRLLPVLVYAAPYSQKSLASGVILLQIFKHRGKK